MAFMAPEFEANRKKFEDVKDSGPLFHCNNFDTELVHKIAQNLVMGLSTACVDNTTGDLFKGPGSVAVVMRKEMVEYLTERSENYVAESVIEEGNEETEHSDHPTEIILDFIEDFATLKRNFFGRVSGWLLSEKREDKIDDFVQEMETNGFWLIDRRATVAETLLRNVDLKSTFHCEMKFDTVDELTEHKKRCDFRSLNCSSEGCNASFCAVYMEKHVSVCQFKVIPCEQKCPQNIVRHEMDRHCITVCPMKLVNCPFYQVGCRSTVPQGNIRRHCSELLHSHLLHVLEVIYKDLSSDNLKQRMLFLEKSVPLDRLSEALDVRSLTLVIKEQEAKMQTLEFDFAQVTLESEDTSNMTTQEINGEQQQ